MDGAADSGLRPSAAGILRSGRVPPALIRIGERLRVKAGRLDWERAWLRPLLEARRDALGDRADGPPKFLIRVDEFPYSTGFYDPQRYGLDASRRFHSVMAEHRLSHLMAIVPRPADDPLNPHGSGERGLADDELELIETMRRDGVLFAQHGTTHRTRNANPRRRSELVGLSTAEAASVLDRGRELLREIAIEPRVFVPPFNRFAHSQWSLLAERYQVICGGPESIPLMGYHGGPLWRDEAVYLPCYHPLYASARDVLPIAERMIDLTPGTWIPIVLHVGWEADDGFQALERLAKRLAQYAHPWEAFLIDVDRSKAA
jgi:hypothetical protein